MILERSACFYDRKNCKVVQRRSRKSKEDPYIFVKVVSMMLQAIMDARGNEEALNELFTELWEFPNDKYTNEETLKYNALITYFFKEIDLRKQAEKIEARWGFKL